MRIGKLAKADGIISLNVEIRSDGSDDTTRSATQKMTGSYTISRNVDIGVTMMITSVETDAIIKTASVVSTLPLRQQVTPLKSVLTLPDKEVMMEFAFRRAVDKLANEISPYLELNSIDLVTVDKEVTTVEMDAREDAAKYDSKAFERAYCGYKSLYDNSAMNSAPAAYDLGCLNLVSGNYETALQMFTTADDINAKERRYRDAAQSTEQLVTMLDYYILAGMDTRETNFAEACASVEIPLVLSADLELYSSPDRSSDVVGQGSEGNKYTILEKNGEWTKIKLKRSGTEGWVMSKQLG